METPGRGGGSRETYILFKKKEKKNVTFNHNLYTDYSSSTTYSFGEWFIMGQFGVGWIVM